jgi:hypothetical protein
MPKDTFWFPHDYDSSSDPKIMALFSDYGGLGYGIYWCIIEKLHSDEAHKLPLKKYIYIAISKQVESTGKIKVPITSDFIEEFIKDCIEVFELFDSDNSFFWANRAIRNIEKRKELSAKKSSAGKASARSRRRSKKGDTDQLKNSAVEQKNDVTGVEQMLTGVEQMLTGVEQKGTGVEHNVTKERKGKDRKVNKSIKVLNTSNKQSCCCCYGEEELEKAAAAAMDEFKENLPPEFDIPQQAKILARKYRDQEINLSNLVPAWIENFDPKKNKKKNGGTIIIAGKEHKPTYGNVYPTIVGLKFNKEKTAVELLDGTFQELGKSQKLLANDGGLKPEEVYKGYVS